MYDRQYVRNPFYIKDNKKAGAHGFSAFNHENNFACCRVASFDILGTRENRLAEEVATLKLQTPECTDLGANVIELLLYWSDDTLGLGNRNGSWFDKTSHIVDVWRRDKYPIPLQRPEWEQNRELLTNDMNDYNHAAVLWVGVNKIFFTKVPHSKNDMIECKHREYSWVLWAFFFLCWCVKRDMSRRWEKGGGRKSGRRADELMAFCCVLQDYSTAGIVSIPQRTAVSC